MIGTIAFAIVRAYHIGSMSLFQDFLSAFSGNAAHYSHDQHPLPEAEIRRLVSRASIRTLRAHEEQAVEEALARARVGDGKIWLFGVNETLRCLKNTRRITSPDYQSLMKIFEEYFKKFEQ